MADAGNIDIADDKNSKGNVTIHVSGNYHHTETHLPQASVGNFAGQMQDSASQTASPAQPHTLSSPSTADQLPVPSPRKSCTFIIEGSIKDLTPTDRARLQAFVESLRKRTGDASLTVTEFSEGSIRLTLEGSEDGIAKLQQLVEAGELSEILSRPVKEVNFSEPDVSNQSQTFVSSSENNETDVSKYELESILTSKEQLLFEIYVAYLLHRYCLSRSIKVEEIINECVLRFFYTELQSNKISNMLAWMKAAALGYCRELARLIKPSDLYKRTNESIPDVAQQALEALSLQDQMLLSLRYFQDLSWKEIQTYYAAHGDSDLKIATLKARSSRAYKRLLKATREIESGSIHSDLHDSEVRQNS